MRSDRVLFNVLMTVIVVVFLATMFILVQWFTTSIAITYNGPVLWAEGWDRTMEYWCELAQL